jgi:hypothetical protein
MHGMPIGDKGIDKMGSDKSGTAGDKNFSAHTYITFIFIDDL